MTDHYSWRNFSWSPDGKKLAAWDVKEENATYPFLQTLLVTDTQEKRVTDFCMDEEFVYPEFVNPVWSPDGKFLAISLQRGTEWIFDTTLIDLEHQRAFHFREDTLPVEWLVKP